MEESEKVKWITFTLILNGTVDGKTHSYSYSTVFEWLLVSPMLKNLQKKWLSRIWKDEIWNDVFCLFVCLFVCLLFLFCLCFCLFVCLFVLILLLFAYDFNAQCIGGQFGCHFGSESYSKFNLNCFHCVPNPKHMWLHYLFLYFIYSMHCITGAWILSWAHSFYNKIRDKYEII